MVVRPDYSDKRRVSKTFVYPNGRNRLAQIGMVDSGGVCCYMLDIGTTERFEFMECNELIASMRDCIETAEREETKAFYKIKTLEKANAKALSLVERLLDLCGDMYQMGKYPKEFKGSFKSRMEHIRLSYESMNVVEGGE